MGAIQECVLGPVLLARAKGGQSGRIHKSKARAHDRERMFSQIHQTLKVCPIYGSVSKGKDEKVHIQSVRFSV